MNQRMTKRLRKSLLKNTQDIMFVLVSAYGDRSNKIEGPSGVWRSVKRLYKEGKMPKNLILKRKDD